MRQLSPPRLLLARRSFVADGGLMFSGIDNNDLYRRGILYRQHSPRPGDLPVQNPTKFDLAINLKTA
jgi:putative tryptophan/tyrosine transport system substrate-binding protein